jgi:hypothetical protein
MSKCCKLFKEKLNEGDQFYESRSSVSENGKIFKLVTNSTDHVCKIKLDNGAIPTRSGKKQCDYLLIKCTGHPISISKFFFIELKGSGENANDGFYQIVGALEYLKSKGIAIQRDKIFGVIVGGADTPKMNRLKEDFKKQHGHSLIHKTGKMYESS